MSIQHQRKANDEGAIADAWQHYQAQFQMSGENYQVR